MVERFTSYLRFIGDITTTDMISRNDGAWVRYSDYVAKIKEQIRYIAKLQAQNIVEIGEAVFRAEAAESGLNAVLNAPAREVAEVGPLMLSAHRARAEESLCALEIALEALRHSEPIQRQYPEPRERHEAALKTVTATVERLRSAAAAMMWRQA